MKNPGLWVLHAAMRDVFNSVVLSLTKIAVRWDCAPPLPFLPILKAGIMSPLGRIVRSLLCTRFLTISVQSSPARIQ